MGKTQPLKLFLNQEILVILFALFTHNPQCYVLFSSFFLGLLDWSVCKLAW